MAFQHHFEGYQVCMADEYLYAQDTGSSIACRQNGMTTSRLMLPELKPAVEFAYAFDGWASHYVSGACRCSRCSCTCPARCDYKQLIANLMVANSTSACRAWQNFSAAAATSLVQCVNSMDRVVFHMVNLPEWH